MNRQKSVYAALVALLLGANIWYWWTPAATGVKREPRVVGQEEYRNEDFRLRLGMAVDETAGRVQRDLFHPKVEVVKKPVAVAAKPPEPPAKTPEELAQESARAELAQYKLVGVVFRNGKGQAFIVRGDQVYLVLPGEKVGERFTVEKIAADDVELRDPATNVSGKIPVSGK